MAEFTEKQDKQARKSKLNLSQIQHHNRHGKRETNGFFQLCFYLSKITFPLGKAELSLNLYAFILIEICLLPVALFIFPGSAQSRPAESDSVRLAITEILTVAVDLIRQYAFRVVPLTGFEALYRFNQSCGFIVGIK